MHLPVMKLIRDLSLFALVLSASLAWAAPKRVALLVGVGDYNAPMHKLEGPIHDVQVLQKVLVERWGYAAGDVRALIDKAATRNGIKAELQSLLQRTQPGDEVFLYLSGHGTSSLQSGFEKAVPDGSGAFYAFDSTNTGANLLVGRTDIRPVLEQLDKGGRKVWFVADTCFSGNMARNMASQASVPLRQKTVPLADDGGFLSVLSGARQNLKQQKDEGDWPYQNVVFLSASAPGEPAIDIGSAGLKVFPTTDDKPHAAMTDALLRVLEGKLPADINRDGSLSLQEVYETVTLFMSSRPYGQYPQRSPGFKDDRNGLARAPLMRGSSVAAPAGQYEPEPVRVYVMPCANKEVVAAIDKLRRVPGVTLVDKLDATTRAVLSVSRDNKHMMLLAPDGATINAVPLADVSAVAGGLHQLVWHSKIEALAKTGRRAALEAEITPSEVGVTRVIGDKIDLAVRPDKDAHLLLLNVNALGEVSVVYPFQSSEVRKLQGGDITKLAGFPVEAPEGNDIQLWFAFDKQPASLPQQVGRLNMKPGDPRTLELERLIAQESGSYAFARTEFRTYAPESLKRPIATTLCKP